MLRPLSRRPRMTSLLSISVHVSLLRRESSRPFLSIPNSSMWSSTTSEQGSLHLTASAIRGAVMVAETSCESGGKHVGPILSTKSLTTRQESRSDGTMPPLCSSRA
eukprot:CAMPEP_0169474026 /NCGR_PEP_ID=MMETSP1042-20121227/26030_1 /TAXON_ID=464988 /ORGANISM="Hemiselmis andersenii, Strain CCMP1180" /LENGTH=105 /DNA_ID=CAMNT_0009588015 /DNA_START=14 /DNA_END=327 /DNA_ORIENTATION=+